MRPFTVRESARARHVRLHLSLAGYWQLATGVVSLAERLCGGRLVQDRKSVV